MVGDVFDEIWKQNSRGEENGMSRQKQPVMDVVEHAGTQARTNLQDLSNTMFMVVICWMCNGNDMVLSPNQLQASYTNVRHCTLGQTKLDK